MILAEQMGSMEHELIVEIYLIAVPQLVQRDLVNNALQMTARAAPRECGDQLV